MRGKVIQFPFLYLCSILFSLCSREGNFVTQRIFRARSTKISLLMMLLPNLTTPTISNLRYFKHVIRHH